MRWSVALEGAQRQVALEHRTWWQRVIVRVDGVVVLDRSINLAIGYDRGIDVDVEVGGHRLTVAIRATSELRPRYVYALEVDGEVAGGTDRLPSALAKPRPTLTGTVEQIIWASTLIGSVRGLATGHLVETATVVGAATLCWRLDSRAGPSTTRGASDSAEERLGAASGTPGAVTCVLSPKAARSTHRAGARRQPWAAALASWTTR